MPRPPKTFRAADRGLAHAYIGNGKGKTTAAVGVAVRARGYGWKVLFLQFMKSPAWPSGERASLKKLGIHIHVLGQGFYKILNDNKPAIAHRQAATRAFIAAQKALLSKAYQLVIMDELGSAVEEGLLPRLKVEAMFRAHRRVAPDVHLIFTGHQRIPWMLKYCDLVTEMKMVKHPYYRGIIATKGIDY